MKKKLSFAVICAAVALTLVASLTACGSSDKGKEEESPATPKTEEKAKEEVKDEPAVSPTKTLQIQLDLMRGKSAQELETMSILSGEGTIADIAGFTEEDIESGGQVYLDAFLETVFDFDYEVIDETIDGDSAEVIIEVTTYDMCTLLPQLVQESQDAIVSQYTGSGASEDELMAAYYEDLAGRFDALTEKTYVNRTTFTMQKEGNVWVLDDPTDENWNVLFGGLLDFEETL